MPSCAGNTLPPPFGVENPPGKAVVSLAFHVVWLTSRTLWALPITKSTVSPRLMIFAAGTKLVPELDITWIVHLPELLTKNNSNSISTCFFIGLKIEPSHLIERLRILKCTLMLVARC
jgi:hypothetical protein